jgi:hypothetical protein
MGFELERLNEEARNVQGIDRMNWLVDKERDIQFWREGKHWQNRAEGDYSETILLRIKGQNFRFELLPSKNFSHYIQGEVHEYIWERVLGYQPINLHGHVYDEIISIIKEALTVDGGGDFFNQKYPNFVVKFNF